MKIVSIEEVTSHIVETDGEGWSTYRRSGADCWENLVGQSWEPLYNQEQDWMEREFWKMRGGSKES